MSLNLGEVVAYMKMDSTNFEQGIATGISSLGKMGGEVNKFGLLSAGAFAAAAAGAIGLVHMAADYESSTQRLVLSAGESEKNLGMVRDGILALAPAVGDSAEVLSAAMYKIESGGFHGQAGLDALKAAAQGAKTENADLTVVSEALTTSLTDYHLTADKSADVTSKLVAATAAGKMTFEQLAGSLHSVLPVASANHIAMDDILGSLSAITIHGVSADQATQNMANAIRNLSSPSAIAAKEMAMMGISATDVAEHLGQRGLSGTMQLIATAIQKHMGPDTQRVVLNLADALKGLPPKVQDLGNELLKGSITTAQFREQIKAMDPATASQARSFLGLIAQTHKIGTESKSTAEIYQSYTQALSKATGGAQGLNVALMLTGENTKTTKGAIDSISRATSEAGGNVKGWHEIQGTFNQRMSEAKAGLEATGIAIGTKLLPWATMIAGVFANATTFLTSHKAVAEIVAYTLGVVLVGALALLTIATVKWAVTSAASLAGDTAKGAIWLASKLFQYATVSAAGIASAVATGAAWIAANAAMILATGGILLAIGALIAIVVVIIQHWSQIKDFFGRLWQGVKDAFWDFVHWLAGFAGWVLNAIGNVDHLLYDAGSRIIGGLIQGIKDMIGNVGHVIGDVAQTIRNFLPFSPAKEGPLSGDGSPDLSGKKIAMMLAQGVESQLPTVKKAAYDLAANIQLNPQMAMAGSGAQSGSSVNIQNFHSYAPTDEGKLAQELDWMLRSGGK